MANLNDSWSHLSGPVMDSLVTELQRLGRWRRDGPSLRCLNKHWRDQVNARITRVRPMGMDLSYTSSLESLSNMSNLTRLRLDPFLKVQSSSEVRASIISRFNCLSKLTKLTSLELHGCFSENVNLTPDECDQIVHLCPSECFQNVTSVVFNDVPFREGESVSFLKSSPVRKLTFIGIKCCQYSKYLCFHTLRSLEFVTGMVCPNFTKEIAELVSLESLSISSRDHRNIALENLENLSHLTSLVSLHLPDSRIRLPLWLTTLSKLRSLSLRIRDYESNEERIWTLLENFHFLVSLNMPRKINKVQSFMSFYKNAENLRSLGLLAGLCLEYNCLSLLTQLTRLDIDFGETTTTIRLQNLVELSSLQELSLRGEVSLLSIFNNNDPSSLKNLSVLEFDLPVKNSVIEEITLIQSLKKVCFYRCTNLSANAISELKKLPNLKELCFGCFHFGSEIESKPKWKSLFKNLELLCFTHFTSKVYSCRWVYKGFPRVKVTESLEEFWKHSCIGLKTRRPKWHKRG